MKIRNLISFFAVLLSVVTTGATAWAQQEVTYTISYRPDREYEYTLNGSDGTSAGIYKSGSSPKSITAQVGDNVTFSVTSATGTSDIVVGRIGEPTFVEAFGSSYCFKRIDGVYVFTFTSKKQNIVRIQMVGGEYQERIRIVGKQTDIVITPFVTTTTTYCNSKAVTVNWNCENNSAPGKFIVTYADSPQSHVTYETNGGTLPNGNTAIFASGDGLTNFPTPEKFGYTFAGWYYTADFSGDKVDVIPSADPRDYTLNIHPPSTT